MAIRLIEQRLCDSCLTDDQYEAASLTYTLGVGETGFRAIELCEPCAKKLSLPDAAELALASGRTPGEAAAMENATHGVTAPRKRRGRSPLKAAHRDRTERCLECWEPAPHRYGWNTHLRDTHGVVWPASPSEWLTSMCCPLCGREYADFQGLGSHIRAGHEASVTQAYWLARESGDPHGVVASMRTLDDVKAHPGKWAATSRRKTGKS